MFLFWLKLILLMTLPQADVIMPHLVNITIPLLFYLFICVQIVATHVIYIYVTYALNFVFTVRIFKLNAMLPFESNICMYEINLYSKETLFPFGH